MIRFAVASRRFAMVLGGILFVAATIHSVVGSLEDLSNDDTSQKDFFQEVRIISTDGVARYHTMSKKNYFFSLVYEHLVVDTLSLLFLLFLLTYPNEKQRTDKITGVTFLRSYQRRQIFGL
jgi:hypothetical protein